MIQLPTLEVYTGVLVVVARQRLVATVTAVVTVGSSFRFERMRVAAFTSLLITSRSHR